MPQVLLCLENNNILQDCVEDVGQIQICIKGLNWIDNKHN
jgi:hypothetical protein